MASKQLVPITKEQLTEYIDKAKEIFLNKDLLAHGGPKYNWSWIEFMVVTSMISQKKVPQIGTIKRWITRRYCPISYKAGTTIRKIALVNGYDLNSLQNFGPEVNLSTYPFTLTVEITEQQRKWINTYLYDKYR